VPAPPVPQTFEAVGVEAFQFHLPVIAVRSCLRGPPVPLQTV
jgi:hypothetical protein